MPNPVKHSPEEPDQDVVISGEIDVDERERDPQRRPDTEDDEIEIDDDAEIEEIDLDDLSAMEGPDV